MITRAEEQQIVDYLKKINVCRQEIFDELFDHLVTSYEDHSSKTTDTNIKSFIAEEINQNFGGASGIKKMTLVKNKSVRASYSTKLIENIKFYINWPANLVTIGVIFLFFKLLENQTPDKFTILVMTPVVLTMLPPIVLALFGRYSFRRKCRKLQKPYRGSIKNEVIFTQAIFLSNTFHVFNGVKMFFNWHTLDLPSWAILLIASFTVLYLILTLSFLKLFRSEFDFKPTAV